MFRLNVSRFGLATHLALAAALPAALAQFVSVHTLSVSMLWIALAAWIWMMFEPSVLSGETVSRARSRMFGCMIRDPFAWFMLVAVLFALIRWLNSGVALSYDPEKTLWLVKEPAMSIMPASSGAAGFLPFCGNCCAGNCHSGSAACFGKECPDLVRCRYRGVFRNRWACGCDLRCVRD